MSPPVLNVAAYRFVDLDDGPALCERLHAAAETRWLGTVLLAPEGIHLRLAGEGAALRGWLANLSEDTRLAGR